MLGGSGLEKFFYPSDVGEWNIQFTDFVFDNVEVLQHKVLGGHIKDFAFVLIVFCSDENHLAPVLVKCFFGEGFCFHAYNSIGYNR